MNIDSAFAKALLLTPYSPKLVQFWLSQFSISPGGTALHGPSPTVDPIYGPSSYRVRRESFKCRPDVRLARLHLLGSRQPLDTALRAALN